MPTRNPTRKSRGKIQFESPHYRVYEKHPHLLYISAGADIPSVLVRDTHTPLDAKKYAPYMYRYTFDSEDNDC